MDYPDCFIRGISSADYVDEDGRVSAALFQFSDMGRVDEFYEASINWYDDEGALLHVMEQRKEKEPQEFQFKRGAAIIARSEADRIIKNHLYQTVFAYERSPIEGNNYHGNLLRKDKTMKKGIQTVIAASLAMNAKVVARAIL
jgi:hypothetical protein